MNSCFYSSFIFLLNSMLFTLYKKHYYSTCFKILFFTSIVFHYKRNTMTFIIDQLAILNFFIYDIYYLYHNIRNTFWNGFLVTLGFICFIFAIILFCYGYVFQCFCYDHIHSDFYHSMVHYITSFAHVLIVLL